MISPSSFSATSAAAASLEVSLSGLSLDPDNVPLLQDPAPLQSYTPPLALDKVSDRFICKGGDVVTRDGRRTGLTEFMLQNALRSPSSYEIWTNNAGEAIAAAQCVGKGNSVRVYAIFVYATGQAGAFKKVRKGDEQHMQSLQNEAEMLAKIHDVSTVIGIAPRAFDSLSLLVKKNGVEKSRDGFLYPCFAMDGFSYIEKVGSLPAEEFYIRAAQLIFAMRHLHEHKILLGDVKLENVGMDGLKTFFSDFGGALQITDSTPCKMIGSGFGGKESLRLSAPATTPWSDLEAAVNAHDNDNKHEAIAIEKARDVFGLGMVLSAFLLGGYPCEFTDKGFPVLPVGVVYRKSIPTNVSIIIWQMCRSRIEDRWTIEKVYAYFHSHISRFQPQILQTISKLYA